MTEPNLLPDPRRQIFTGKAFYRKPTIHEGLGLSLALRLLFYICLVAIGVQLIVCVAYINGPFYYVALTLEPGGNYSAAPPNIIPLLAAAVVAVSLVTCYLARQQYRACSDTSDPGWLAVIAIPLLLLVGAMTALASGPKIEDMTSAMGLDLVDDLPYGHVAPQWRLTQRSIVPAADYLVLYSPKRNASPSLTVICLIVLGMVVSFCFWQWQIRRHLTLRLKNQHSPTQAAAPPLPPCEIPKQSRIAFACPSCCREVNVSTQFAGKKGKCPHCGNVVVIPVTQDAPSC